MLESLCTDTDLARSEVDASLPIEWNQTVQSPLVARAAKV